MFEKTNMVNLENHLYTSCKVATNVIDSRSSQAHKITNRVISRESKVLHQQIRAFYFIFISRNQKF